MVNASRPDDQHTPDDGDGHDLGLDQFEAVTDDQGISLDQLSQAYAQLLGKGEDPYEPPAEAARVGQSRRSSSRAEAEPDETTPASSARGRSWRPFCLSVTRGTSR